MINIALDGPAGAGKSWLAHTLAEKLGFIHVDTGALYRSIGLYMSRQGIALEDKAGFVPALRGLSVEIGFDGGEQRVYLCGEDVTGLIRSFLLETQRRLARENNVIMDGRDIGTVILPDASVKLFVTASDEVRATRRMLELREKGIDQPFEEVLADMRKRDERDRTRDVAPAVPADDAIILDNSNLDREGTLAEALRIIKEVTGAAPVR